MSEGIPFAPSAAKRIFLETMEMAPISKVVFGTDGYTLIHDQLPGPCWASRLGAVGRTGGRELPDVRTRYEVAGWILSGTARRLYKMDA
ncbi:MAG: hypothetical protein R3A10_01640 [Caldilineaceae bacterium]